MESTVLEFVKDEHAMLIDEMRLVPLARGEIRKEIFEHVKETIVRHMEAEEETVYNRLGRDVESTLANSLSSQSQREHHALKEFLQRLNLMNMNDDAWVTMFIAFMDAAIAHCMEEEVELFNELKEDFSRDELVQMGHDFINVRAHSDMGPDHHATYAL